jgi:hypothetical protein
MDGGAVKVEVYYNAMLDTWVVREQGTIGFGGQLLATGKTEDEAIRKAKEHLSRLAQGRPTRDKPKKAEI